MEGTVNIDVSFGKLTLRLSTCRSKMVLLVKRGRGPSELEIVLTSMAMLNSSSMGFEMSPLIQSQMVLRPPSSRLRRLSHLRF